MSPAGATKKVQAPEQWLNGATLQSKNAAKRAAQNWLRKQRGKGLVLKSGLLKSQYTTAKKRSITIYNKSWYVTVIFKRKVDAAMDAAQLQKAFSHIALSRLPVPGLEVEHWRIRPQTPVSSFSNGIVFMPAPKGQMKLRVKTSFFALYGNDTRARLPQDIASPPETFFQVRRTFTGDITMQVKLPK